MYMRACSRVSVYLYMSERIGVFHEIYEFFMALGELVFRVGLLGDSFVSHITCISSG